MGTFRAWFAYDSDDGSEGMRIYLWRSGSDVTMEKALAAAFSAGNRMLPPPSAKPKSKNDRIAYLESRVSELEALVGYNRMLNSHGYQMDVYGNNPMYNALRRW